MNELEKAPLGWSLPEIYRSLVVLLRPTRVISEKWPTVFRPYPRRIESRGREGRYNRRLMSEQRQHFLLS